MNWIIILIGIIMISIGYLITPANNILGGLIIAIGTFLTIYGPIKITSKDNSTINKKLDEFNTLLETAKSIASPMEEKKIEIIQNEFNDWAKSLSSNKEQKRLKIHERYLQKRQKELILNKEWRHLYEEAKDTLVNLIKAYNDANDSKLEMKIFNLTDDTFNNIFDDKFYKFSIQFKVIDNVVGTMHFVKDSVYTNYSIPSIYFNHENDFNEHVGLIELSFYKRFFFGTKIKRFQIISNNDFPTALYRIKNFPTKFQIIAKEFIEYLLLYSEAKRIDFGKKLN